MASNKTMMRVTVVLCCVSLLLQILGYSCPGWLVISLDLDMLGELYPGVRGLGRVVTHAAVWYVQVCVHGSDRLFNFKTCSTSSRHDSDTMGLNLIGSLSGLVDVNWLEIGVELTLALAACIGAITVGLLAVCDARIGVSSKVMYALASGLMLLSGILILPGVIKVSEAIKKGRSTIAIVSEFTEHQFVTIYMPWALVISAVAMVIACLCCFLFIISACKLNEKTSPIVRPQQSEDARQQPPGSPIHRHSQQSVETGRLPPVHAHGNREMEVTVGPYLVFPPVEGQSRVAYYYSGESHPILDSRPPPYEELYRTKGVCSQPGAESTDDSAYFTSNSVSTRDTSASVRDNSVSARGISASTRGISGSAISTNVSDNDINESTRDISRYTRGISVSSISNNVSANDNSVSARDNNESTRDTCTSTRNNSPSTGDISMSTIDNSSPTGDNSVPAADTINASAQ